MGTKRKFWLTRSDGSWFLFKFARVNNGIATGEDWAEKITTELAFKLGIASAKVELARCNGERGVCSESFTQRGRINEHGTATVLNDQIELVHGNELLLER